MQEPMIVNCSAYRAGKKVADIDIADISEALKQDGTFVWVGLHEPDEALLRTIQTEFGLHELAIEDAHAAHQHPKIEEYGDTLFVVVQTAQMSQQGIQFGETHVFLGRRFLVSIRHGPSLPYVKVRERCEFTPERLTQGPAFALYAIMDFIVDNYRPIVDAMHSRFEIIERDLFQARFSRESIEALYDLKLEALQLRSAAAPVLDICNALIRFHTDIIPKDAHVYFRDIHDHARRVTEATDSMREMFTAAMQVNLALVTVSQNEVVKKLAGWGAILAVPTMVFSLYGMNFHWMPELSWKFAYPAIMVLVVTGCTWLYRRLRRVGWL